MQKYNFLILRTIDVIEYRESPCCHAYEHDQWINEFEVLLSR